MSTAEKREPNASVDVPHPSALADRAFSRAAGAPLVGGNSVRLLKDARENYPAWLDAIGAAKRYVHFESYIVHEDETGRRFADALIAKAREGVSVRLLYDWMGGFGKTSRRFWDHLRAGGVEVRCYNPPRLASPLGWLSRDHRKSLVVDGRVAFVSGLCVGDDWVGKPEEGKDPWRDTGVSVEGPAVADVARAFAQVWAMTGPPVPEADSPAGRNGGESPAKGGVALRVVAEVPGSAEVLRSGQLVAALARERLWLTDAYFAATTAYVQALRAAARDGVDVRLLVPGSSDIRIMQTISRASYRPLLEAGVRVFEWNGAMLHAKTAVADGRAARVGSTNLNIASWLGNCELNVFVEDERFAAQVAAMYEEDLQNATEIVLDAKNKVRETGGPRPSRGGGRKSSAGSTNRAVAGAISIGNTIGAAFTNRRALGPVEAHLMLVGGVSLLLLAVFFAFFPRVLVYPLLVIFVWFGAALLHRGYRLYRGGERAAGALEEHAESGGDAEVPREVESERDRAG